MSEIHLFVVSQATPQRGGAFWLTPYTICNRDVVASFAAATFGGGTEGELCLSARGHLTYLTVESSI